VLFSTGELSLVGSRACLAYLVVAVLMAKATAAGGLKPALRIGVSLTQNRSSCFAPLYAQNRERKGRMLQLSFGRGCLEKGYVEVGAVGVAAHRGLALPKVNCATFFTAVLLFALAMMGGCACSGDIGETAVGGFSPEELVDETFSEADAPHPKDYEFKGKVLSVENATNSSSALSEADVNAELERRGFGGVEVLSNYDMQGNYDAEYEATGGSSVHPMYFAQYETKDGEPWLLLVVDGEIMATPLGAISESSNQVIVCEYEYVTVYNAYTNEFIVGIPDGSEMAVEKVEHVNAQTLESFSRR